MGVLGMKWLWNGCPLEQQWVCRWVYLYKMGVHSVIIYVYNGVGFYLIFGDLEGLSESVGPTCVGLDFSSSFLSKLICKYQITQS